MTSSSCACVGVAMGSYDNQEERTLPFATERYPAVGTKRVGIDRCILPDVERLWLEGIETVESCCGHGVTRGYILVVTDAAPKMQALGYEPEPNSPGLVGLFKWPATRQTPAQF